MGRVLRAEMVTHVETDTEARVPTAQQSAVRTVHIVVAMRGIRNVKDVQTSLGVSHCESSQDPMSHPIVGPVIWRYRQDRNCSRDCEVGPLLEI